MEKSLGEARLTENHIWSGLPVLPVGRHGGRQGTLLSSQASESRILTANPVRSAGWLVRQSIAARSDAPFCISRGSV